MAVIVGIFGIIGYLDRKLAGLKKDVCKDINELKEEIRCMNGDAKETLAKFNEHLIFSEQALAQLARLKEHLSSHDEELEELQRHTAYHDPV